MPDLPRPSQVRLRDPLSPVTRAERRSLLGVSAVGLVIAKSGLVPTKISALGVDFSNADQHALLSMGSLAVVYFIVAFTVYATSDLVAWRIEFNQTIRDWTITLRTSSN